MIPSVAALPRSPEMALLLCCISPLPTPAEVAAVDWPRFQAVVTHHHLLPLVYRCLKSAADNGAAVPPEWLAFFKQQAYDIAAFNLRATGILRRLQRLARERGVALIPVKGPALAMWAYASTSLRQFEDLDLVVRPAELLVAVELLEQEGYQLRELSPRTDRQRYLRSRQDWSLQRPAEAPHLDLKPVLISHTLCGPESADYLLETSRRIDTGDDGDLASPGPEAMLLAVCVDGANESWPKLSAVADVAALLANHSNADWTGLVAEAKRLGQWRSLLVGVALADILLSGPMPSVFAEAIDRDATAQRLALAAARLLAAGRLPRDEGVQAARFAWKTRDDWRGRLRLLRRLLFIPGAADLDWVALPSALYPLYAGLRPCRLAWDAVRRRPRRICSGAGGA
ncbi:MAG: nucleotidyltransferase family protein [Kiritimatiellia bacterium]|jgi:hypothetical protein|nr:nucleotidyltransferase family protein [Kiritimatiellia bacterium]